MREAKYRKRIFYQYVLSYSLIILLSILFMVGIDVVYLKNQREKDYALAERSLLQSMANIENRFEEINNLTQLVATNKNLIDSMDETNYYTKYQLFQDLNRYCYTNAFIQNIYVFFEQDDLVIGSDGIITNKEMFYRIKYDQGYDHYQQWLQKDWDWQNFSGNLNVDEIRTSFDDTEQVLQYIWPVYNGTGPDGKNARIYIYIDQDELRSLIVQAPKLENFSIWTPENGNTIFLGDILTEKQIEQNDYLSIEKTSLNGRQYSCTLRRDDVFKEWYRQVLFNICLLVVACILCGFISYFMARYNSAPMERIFDLVHSDSDTVENGVLDYVQGKVSDILQNQQQLEAELQRRIPLLQVSFIERLLSGTLSDYSDLKDQMNNLHISLQGDYYCVAILQITGCPDESRSEDDKPFASARLIVEHIARIMSEENLYIYSMEGDLVTVIFALTQKQLNENYPAIFCQQVSQRATVGYGIDLSYAIGRSYAELADIFLSYMQANNLINTQNISGTYENSNFSYFYYPVELEQKLIRIILSGNEETVHQIFDELQQENLQKRHLSSSMYQQLMRELQGTFVKTLAVMDENQYCTNELKQVLEVPSLYDSQKGGIELYRTVFLEAAGLVYSGKTGKAAEYKNRIKSYMEEHYTEPAMSLGMLADSFKVTEVYMSKLFKKNLGMTFSQYLEELRMQKAAELLHSSRLSIHDISEACGYQSPHAFRRAYKRYYGNLPSDTRKEN